MTSQVEKIKVLIADDHQIVRQGLRTFLELQQEIVVVGEAGDGLNRCRDIPVNTNRKSF